MVVRVIRKNAQQHKNEGQRHTDISAVLWTAKESGKSGGFQTIGIVFVLVSISQSIHGIPLSKWPEYSAEPSIALCQLNSGIIINLMMRMINSAATARTQINFNTAFVMKVERLSDDAACHSSFIEGSSPLKTAI